MALSKKELSKLADQARKKFEPAEKEAAEREIEQKRRHRARNDSIIPVRLDADLYEAVQAAANQRHLAPSVLIRQWVAQSVSSPDKKTNVADELERLAALVRAGAS